MIARLAPFVFIALWSSAFIAVRAGLPDVSPLYFLAVRFVIAAAVLVALALATGQSWAGVGARWHHLALTGALINAVYLSMAYIAMQRVSGAVMALIGTLNPMLVAVLAGPVLGERFTVRQWAGVLLGILGVALTVGARAAESAAELVPMLIGAAGIFALTFGTLYHGRHGRGIALLPANAVQMLAAAATATLFVLLLETPRAVWTPTAIAALLWLALAVSVGCMGLFLYLLKTGTAGKVAANFYLTPGVAAVMGWAILGETLSPLGLAGLAIASAGVWLVQSSR